jgi:hypothetical protein
VPMCTGRPATLQRRADTSASPSAPDAVAPALAAGGAPLDAATRGWAEQRFGHSFAGVRVHDGEAARRSAAALGARAYTVGSHVVFGAGGLDTHSTAGRRLLAHELAHVVQQGAGAPRVQREPAKGAQGGGGKVDVSIVLSDADQDMKEGSAYAGTVLRVTSADDAAAQLKALGKPVGTLFVVSHSSAAGEVEFVSGIGTISWVPLRDLAKALKGATTIDTIDFRGCKVGDAPAAMEGLRSTLGAQSTKGSTCWTFISRVTPLVYDGAEITSPSQIPPKMQQAFNNALLRQINGLITEDRQPVRNCLVGLAPGEKAGPKTLATVWKLYWANGGHLVASWGSPEYNKNWQKGSICSKDMTASTTPCALVEKKAPAPGGGGSGSGSGKTSAVQVLPGETVDSTAMGDDRMGGDEERV